MKEKFQTIGGILLYIAFFGLYIIGGIHSENKHHESGLAWWLPPLGLYRGIEQLWHNDFAGVDWDEKFHSDTKVLFYLIYTGMQQNRDELKFQNDLNQFQAQIKNYPNDKITILKKNASTYITFLNSMDNDFLKLVSYDTIFFKHDFMSLKTKSLLDSIGILTDTTERNDFTIGIEQSFGKVDTTIYLQSGSHNKFTSNTKVTEAKLQTIKDDIFKKSK